MKSILYHAHVPIHGFIFIFTHGCMRGRLEIQTPLRIKQSNMQNVWLENTPLRSTWSSTCCVCSVHITWSWISLHFIFVFIGLEKSKWDLGGVVLSVSFEVINIPIGISPPPSFTCHGLPRTRCQLCLLTLPVNSSS